MHKILVDPLTQEPLWQQPRQRRQQQPQLPPPQQRQQRLQHYSEWPPTSEWQKPQLWDCCCCLREQNFTTFQSDTEVWRFVLCARKQKRTVTDTAALTHSTQCTDSSIVLSWQVLLMAHRAHAISPWVAIETTASGTEHRNWTLIGLLGHSDVCHLWADLETERKDTWKSDECLCMDNQQT